MKRLILSWVSTLLLILLGFTQHAQATITTCTASDECFDFKFMGAQKVDNDYVRLTFSVTTNCSHELSYAAFELPNGAGNTSHAESYSSLKYKYTVENGTNNPFYSIKFEGVGMKGYKDGAEDIFTYDVSAYEYSTMKTLRVAAKASTTVGMVTFDLAKCGAVAGSGSTGGGNNGNGNNGNNGSGNNGNGNNGGGGNCSTSQPSAISGPYDPCPGDIVTYCIQANSNYTSYVWDVPRAHAGNPPSGWEIISGQGTNCVTVRVGMKPGTMKVKVTHTDCGTKVRTKPVHPGKKLAVEVTGPDQFCQGDVLKFVADVDKVNGNGNGNGGNQKFFDYVWSVPAGWEIVSGQGTNQLIVKAGNAAGEVAVSVSSNKKKNDKLCGIGSDAITVTKKPTCTPCAKPIVSLVAPDTVCNLSENIYRFSVGQVQEGVNYEFQLPEGFVIVNEGEGFVEAIAIFEEDQLNQPQTVRVIATNECGTAIAEVTVRVVECEPGGPLPVTLTRFEGTSRSGKVELAWTTASEINNARFEIERSANGTDFTKVGEVKGNGTTTATIDYTFADSQAPAGTMYYRLRQVDFDNSSEYSKVISVRHALVGAGNVGAGMQVFPNPVNGNNVNIRFAQVPQGEVNVRLVDMAGRVLHTKTLGSDGILEIGALGLKQGIYLLSVTNGGKTDTQRLIVQ